MYVYKIVITLVLLYRWYQNAQINDIFTFRYVYIKSVTLVRVILILFILKEKRRNKILYFNLVSPICKHVLNFGGWRYQNATPPPFNVPEDVHGALKHETISLVCEVEANPTTVTFHWTFNSSGDLNDIPSTKYSSESTISRLNYTPSTDMDYGTLGCWASNVVGQSKQPCLYQVIAAGSCKFNPISYLRHIGPFHPAACFSRNSSS